LKQERLNLHGTLPGLGRLSHAYIKNLASYSLHIITRWYRLAANDEFKSAAKFKGVPHQENTGYHVTANQDRFNAG